MATRALKWIKFPATRGDGLGQIDDDGMIHVDLAAVLLVVLELC